MEKVNTETVGKRLAAIRKARGLSREQVAEELESSPYLVAQAEGGKMAISYLIAFCSWAGYSAFEIVADDFAVRVER